MEETIKGYVIVAIKHPTTNRDFLNSPTFRETKGQCIRDFVSGSGATWKFWYRKFNFRCVKATSTITVQLTQQANIK